jgi:hypothetical protein
MAAVSESKAPSRRAGKAAFVTPLPNLVATHPAGCRPLAARCQRRLRPSWPFP